MKHTRTSHEEGKSVRAEIRLRQRVSQEFLLHLQANPMHALGRPEIICAECARMGPIKPTVCLEDRCGRVGLRQLAAHVGSIHHLSINNYKRNHDYSPREHMTSPEFHEERSKLSSTDETLERLKPFHFFTKKQSISAGKGRHSEAIPSRFKKQPYWPIASRCLKGRERLHVAAQLGMWPNTVNRCCAAMRFPSRPTRFWRGEPVTDRHLHDLMRDFDLAGSEVKVATLTALPIHRIRRALAQKRKGHPLHIEVADKILRIRQQLSEEKQHTGVTASGGRPPKLTPSESREVPWKFRVLLREIRILSELLPSASRVPIPEIGELICSSACKGKARRMLLFWARPFLAWLTREHDLNPKALSSPAAAARGFFASQYQVSEDTIENLLPKKALASDDRSDLKRRKLLVDLDTLMADELRLPTSEILRRLPDLRHCWRELKHPRSLAALLRPLGVQPRELRVGNHVVRGYRREDLGIYSAEDVAIQVGVTLQGLKQWIRLGKIPVPPIVSRSGVRGRGSIRLWTKADIAAVKATISMGSRTVYRVSPSATPTDSTAVM
jgi:hypothetical protein